MKTIEEVSNAVGGSGGLSRLIGVKQSTASEMLRRGSIPVKYWPRLVDTCKDLGVRGVNYDVLVDLHSAKSPKGDAE